MITGGMLSCEGIDSEVLHICAVGRVWSKLQKRTVVWFIMKAQLQSFIHSIYVTMTLRNKDILTCALRCRDNILLHFSCLYYYSKKPSAYLHRLKLEKNAVIFVLCCLKCFVRCFLHPEWLNNSIGLCS